MVDISPNQSSHATAAQSKGMSIFDVDGYFSDPSNASLLAAPPQSTSPVPLGTHTSHHVTALNLRCQAKRLPTPVFDLKPRSECDAICFEGVVRVGELMVRSQKTLRNKKEVKEHLAEEALRIVERMASGAREVQPSPSNTANGKKWVTILHEYHSSVYAGTQAPTYNYFSLGLLFSATCVIPSYPDRVFGSQDTPFPSKKAAQSNAAKEAVELLIAEGKVNQDGTIIPVKKKKLNNNLDGHCFEVEEGCSYGQKVDKIAHFLGLPALQYHLSQCPAAPNMVSGFAIFLDQHVLEGLRGQLGEVRNVYGKKNARDEIAKAVWELLRRVAEQRGSAVREIG
ncbi:MAG: hypothetical protein Q9163_003451 [Psora crenata]